MNPAPMTSEVAVPASRSATQRLAAYVELTKPRLNSLVLVTAAIGYYWRAEGVGDGWRLLQMLFGTALAAGGASALNQFLERHGEAQMIRTRTRPLPSGRLWPAEALWFGIGLSLAGLLFLALMVNGLTAVLAAWTVISYAFVYTPLKTRTPLCTWVGAVPGAIPPMIGWAAAHNALSAEAWVLFAILFAWQLPHFLAIAWLYRDDYVQADYAILTARDPQGRATGAHVVGWTVLLIAASLAPWALDMAGARYAVGALALGMLFLAFGAALAARRTDGRARALFYASIVYLPLLLTLLLVD